MRYATLHKVIIVFLINEAMANNSIAEVCDVEGSGLDDCPDDRYCCKQSKCDAFYPDYVLDDYIDIVYDQMRCCTESEVKRTHKPTDCKICTKCCHEYERKRIPRPEYCSKCHMCKGLGKPTTSVAKSKWPKLKNNDPQRTTVQNIVKLNVRSY